MTAKCDKQRFHDSLPLENALLSWVCARVSWAVMLVFAILTLFVFMGFL